MKFNPKILLCFIALSFLCSCALAPFSEPHTAQTLGKGGNVWSIAGGAPSYFNVNYARGFSDRLDIGGNIEYQSLSYLLGLHGKYLLTPEIKDDPMSLFFGAGVGNSSQYMYLGLIKSLRVTESYEIGLSGRYNMFHWHFNDRAERQEAEEYIDELIGDMLDSVNGVFSYVSVDMSNTYWMNSRLGLTLSVSRAQFVTRASGGFFKGGLKMHYKY